MTGQDTAWRDPEGAGAFRRVGVVGGGLIGMSWASLFLARGLEVVVCDPRRSVERELRAFAAEALPKLEALDLAVVGRPDHAPDRVTVTQDFAALAGVEFVQENGPDRIEAKREIVAQIERAVDPDVVIASSTSSLTASELQKDARHPARILVGHPMNPPHLVPMVELVPGGLTSASSLETAERFYRQMRRVTVRVRKEVVGHLANRLTSALYREAVHLVAEGIATVEDVDRAVTYGPGLRWSLIGPHLTYHLGGGTGGYRHYLDHLGPTQVARWREHATPDLNEEVKRKLVEGLERELCGQDEDTLVQRRDAALVELLALKKRHGF